MEGNLRTDVQSSADARPSEQNTEMENKGNQTVESDLGIEKRMFQHTPSRSKMEHWCQDMPSSSQIRRCLYGGSGLVRMSAGLSVPAT